MVSHNNVINYKAKHNEESIGKYDLLQINLFQIIEKYEGLVVKPAHCVVIKAREELMR